MDTKSIINKMHRINFVGHITPPAWYQTLRYPNGKPHLVAVTVLSDIVYWYRPRVILCEKTGKVLRLEKKFKGDKLQRSNGYYEEAYGLTKKQVRDALAFLQQKGVIIRTVTPKLPAGGRILRNVQYVEIVPSQLEKITHPEELKIADNEGSALQVAPSALQVTPISPTGQTCTETTNTETTNKHTHDAAKQTAPPNGEAPHVRVPEKQKTDKAFKDAVDECCDEMVKGLRIDTDLMTPFQKKQVGETVGTLWKKGKIKGPDDIREFFKRYYDPSPENWRGKGGNPPAHAGRVLELWGEYMGEKAAQNGGGKDPAAIKLTDEQKEAARKLNELYG